MTSQSRTHIPTITMLTLFLCMLLMHSAPLTVCADYTENLVNTEDELFDALTHQILEHKSDEAYYINSNDLLSLVSSDQLWEDFLYHYNPDDPLHSGCYTYFCINGGQASRFANSRSYKLTLYYNVPKNTMVDYYEEMKTLAAKLRGENDYESVKNAHDYLINRVEYDHSLEGTNFSDIEGLRENRMVCQGYSMATYVLLTYMGIPVRMVHGEAGKDDEREGHAWNVVQVDGKWYNYDATWDDAGENGVRYTYFLKSNADFPMHYPEGIYAYSEFQNMISEESYAAPGIGNFNIGFVAVLIGIAVFAIILFALPSRSSHIAAATQAASSSASGGVIVNDDFDDYMQETVISSSFSDSYTDSSEII